MFAFIPPNNAMHHPIRAGKPFITRPHRRKIERWEWEKEREMGGSGRREVSRGTAGEQSKWDNTTVILSRLTAVCAQEKAHLGRTSTDRLRNMAAIRSAMFHVMCTRTNVSLSRAGSNFTILTPSPTHSKVCQHNKRIALDVSVAWRTFYRNNELTIWEIIIINWCFFFPGKKYRQLMVCLPQNIQYTNKTCR